MYCSRIHSLLQWAYQTMGGISMIKKARTYRLTPEGIETLERLVVLYNEMNRTDFKTIRISQADVLEKIIRDHYDQLSMQVEKSVLDRVEEQISKK
jgi:DNA-binding PadR family transcriptional regulator